jgi:hypothetical protein
MHLSTTLVSIAAIAGSAYLIAPHASKIRPKANGRTPVLVELFTSEGCSSCPPADKLLETLSKTQPIDGADVIVLSEHVDYWNSIGWKDPFSKAQFSSRQAGYVTALRLQGSYTPQMVVDGKVEFVGSDDQRAADAISAAASRRKASVSLNVSEAQTANPTVHIKVGDAPANSELWLAVTEDGLHSNVTNGENSGRRLTHTGVVRSLRRLGSIPSNSTSTTDVSIATPPSWNRNNVKIVAFVQAPNQGAVYGAGAISL